MTRIQVSNYMNNSSKNYGVNSLMVELGDITLYFSYETVVAFDAPGFGITVSENDWGPTTGKHLNSINIDKDLRLPREQFEVELERMLASFNLSDDYDMPVSVNV